MEMARWYREVKTFLMKARALFLTLKSSHHFTARSLVLLFVVAFSTGFFIKTVVHDSLTIGYDDYRLTRMPVIDLNAVQKELIRDGGSSATQESTPRGQVCDDEVGQ